MLDDFRVALRGLTRAKSVTAVLLISLGLGTGANVAVFRVVHGLLFGTPAGVAGATSLVDVYTSRFDGAAYGPSSYPDFQSLSATDAVFEGIAAIDDETTADVSLGQARQQTRIAGVSADFFTLLKIEPLRGRFLTPEDSAMVPPGAVISSELWETFGGADDIIGRTILVGAQERTIVGIAPDRFQGLRADRVTDLWIPLSPETTDRARGDRGLSVIARLQPAIGMEEARSRLRAIAADLAQRYPATNRGVLGNPDAQREFTLAGSSSLDPATRQQTFVVAAVIIGAVVLLLVCACVNAGNLLLSRAWARRREIAVKLALGATQRLLIRQLLAEVLIVSVASAAFGLLFAFWTLGVIPALFAPEQAALLDTRLDARVVLVTIAVSIVAGVLFGLIPALGGPAESAALALRGDSGEISERQSGSRWRGALVIVQLGSSVALILGAGFLVASLAGALEGDLGPTARNIALFTVNTPAFARHLSAADRALEGVEGIEEIAWTSAPPLTRGAARRLRVETGGTGVLDAIEINVTVVSSRYFQAIRLPMVEGREFNAGDGGRAKPVVIIDEVLARRYFGSTAAGRFLVDGTGTRLEIVGVVRSGRYRTLQESPPPTVYYPITQEFIPRAYIVVRTASEPGPMLDPFARRLSAVNLAIERTSTLQARLAERFPLDRLVSTLVGVCGLIALIMASMGVYGVMNDTVRRRTREIGLRVALGARRPQVARLVLGQALYLTGVGLAVGVGSAWLVARLFGTFVHGLPGLDPFTLTATPAVLAIVVAAAGVLPLQRALRVSPTIALRAE